MINKPTGERGDARRLVPAALVVAVTAVSFAAIFFRKALPTHPLEMSGIRLIAAAVVLSPWTIRGLARSESRKRMLIFALPAGLLYGVHFGAWVTSLTMTGIAASVTLVTVTPLLLAILGWLTGRDRPDARLWAALALAAVGLTLIGGADLAADWRRLAGDGLALLGAVAVAGFMLIGRRMGKTLDVLAFSGLATAVGGATLLATAAGLGIPIRAASTEAMVYILLAALIPQLVGHNLLTWCLRHTRPTVVGMAVVGEPVGATILGLLWLGEGVTPQTALGCAIILGGVILALVERPPRPSS